MGVRFAILLLVFSLSGLTGLIYESIWTHYLKLYLGHAAYAQTLVLAIFMGGMALGAAICSRYSAAWKKLILLYALIEGLIGIFALGFHGVFVKFLGFSYDSLLPSLESAGLIMVTKWTTASLLILPQSILLGATFPLLSAGILRAFAKTPGASLSYLYFCNSLGGALGVLLSGFLLIKYVGLPGTLLTGGIINILIAMTIWLLFKDFPEDRQQGILATKTQGQDASHHDPWLSLLLMTAFITGVASFIYEVTWIRMLSLVLGSSTHAFELMLSAFIFGLAFGGIWVRKRIDGFASPIKALAIIQIVMGLFAVLTLYFYNQTFEIMRFVFQSLSKTDGGYFLFNLLSHGICFIIMLPATFCAGMTLPLITYNLLQKGHGEKAIGAVYSVNTLGAIVGIVVCVHFSMWYMGLKGSIFLGAALDIAMGLVLISRVREKLRWGLPSYATAVALIFIVSIFVVQFDAYKMMSGVYRNGELLSSKNTAVIPMYHADGKTSTVDLVKHDGVIYLRNNGKGDASLSLEGKFTVDEQTQVLLAALPAMYMTKPKRAAVIGMGLGMTSHVLLHNASLQALHTIEIEQGVVDAATKIRPRNELLFSDNRSHIHVEDAKTFFSLDNRNYDIIISEPSNPWVSGIASLFSTEFYALVAKKLGETGVFSQWIQVYEIDDKLVASIIKAMRPHFADFKVYFANSGDMVLLAKAKGAFATVDYSMFQDPRLTKLLQPLKITGAADIAKRYAGGRQIIEPFVNQYPLAANSDYFPVLDQLAVRTRFLGSRAEDLLNISMDDLPIVDILAAGAGEKPIRNDKVYRLARDYYGYLMGQGQFSKINSDKSAYAEYLKIYMQNCHVIQESKLLYNSIFAVGMATVGRLSRAEAGSLWLRLKDVPCNGKLSQRSGELIEYYHLMAGDYFGAAAEKAASLLQHHQSWNHQASYLLNSALLGYIKAQRYQAAKDLWISIAGKHKIQPQSSLRLLLAHLDKKISPAIVKN